MLPHVVVVVVFDLGSLSPAEVTPEEPSSPFYKSAGFGVLIIIALITLVAMITLGIFWVRRRHRGISASRLEAARELEVQLFNDERD